MDGEINITTARVMELSSKSDLCIGNLAKSDVSSCYTISTLKARKTYVTGRKRQHLSSASCFGLCQTNANQVEIAIYASS